jgi:manganese-dependent inorganic pyrophosphatase
MSENGVIYVVGHKSPDTDSICSAIALVHLLNSLGYEAVACRQGEPNNETRYVLNRFGVEVPNLLTDGSGKKVFLVDHSDVAQSLDNLDKAEIFGIIDHHKIGDVTTPQPVYFLALPVGCSSTIVGMLYDYFNVEIPEKIAGIMTCAILSDTVIFRSATTTEKDKEIAKKLAYIAGIDDVEKLGVQLFKEKSDIVRKSPREILLSDFKEFDFAGYKVGIGQVEVVSLSLLDNVKDALFEEMKRLKEESGFHGIFFMLTDIMQEGTELMAVGANQEIFEKAFGKQVEGNSVYLEGVMSRKKQVVPPLQKAYESQ